MAKPADAAASSAENFRLFIQNTGPGSAAGLPGLSIPMGLTPQGLPAGLEIDGLHDMDDTLLSLGLVLENLLLDR